MSGIITENLDNGILGIDGAPMEGQPRIGLLGRSIIVSSGRTCESEISFKISGSAIRRGEL